MKIAYKNIGRMLQKSLEHFWSSFLVKIFQVNSQHTFILFINYKHVYNVYILYTLLYVTLYYNYII